MSTRQGRRAAVAVAIVALAGAAVAVAGPKNGGFETGKLRPWKVKDPGGGDWFVYKGKRVVRNPGGGGVVRPRGMGGPNPARFFKPPRGRRAAATYQNGPGLNILHRVIRVKPEHETLSFFLAWRNEAERFHTPSSFAFREGGGTPARARRGGGGSRPNQQFRIDLLKPKAPVKSLKRRQIEATVFRIRRGDRQKRGYRKLTFKLRGLSGKLRFRVAEVDNQAPLLVGIDQLKLKK